MRNKYFYCSRISEKKFRELIRLFSLDMEALKISALTGLNRNTVNHVLTLLRERLSDICEREDIDGFRSYISLRQHGYEQHETVNHGANEFARKDVHVNGIEGFWSVAKTRLARFRGLRPSSFSLHLKETEYRFNHRYENLYQLILTNLHNETLN